MMQYFQYRKWDKLLGGTEIRLLYVMIWIMDIRKIFGVLEIREDPIAIDLII